MTYGRASVGSVERSSSMQHHSAHRPPLMRGLRGSFNVRSILPPLRSASGTVLAVGSLGSWRLSRRALHTVACVLMTHNGPPAAPLRAQSHHIFPLCPTQERINKWLANPSVFADAVDLPFANLTEVTMEIRGKFTLS
jgi:hypothetical protein